MQNSSVKWKLLAIPISIGVIVMVVMFIKYMNYRTSRQYLEEAAQFVEDGDGYNAFICFHNSVYYDEECGDCYFEWAKFEYYFNNDFKAAHKKMKSVFKYYDDDEITDVVNELMGKTLFRTKKLADSKKYFSKVESEGDSVDYYEILLLAEENQVRPARDELIKYANKKGEGSDLYYDIARLSFKTDDYALTEEYCDKGIALEPKKGKFYYLKAKALFYSQDSTNAGCKYLNDALNLDFEDSENLQDEFCDHYSFKFVY